MARLSLSSVALRDGIVHGLPVTGRELGIYHCVMYKHLHKYMYTVYFLV